MLPEKVIRFPSFMHLIASCVVIALFFIGWPVQYLYGVTLV